LVQIGENEGHRHDERVETGPQKPAANDVEGERGTAHQRPIIGEIAAYAGGAFDTAGRQVRRALRRQEQHPNRKQTEKEEAHAPAAGEAFQPAADHRRRGRRRRCGHRQVGKDPCAGLVPELIARDGARQHADAGGTEPL
jgi:hypothetical protein